MISGVYEIRNKLTGQRYIGSAVNFEKRWYSHRSDLRRGVHHSTHLQRAWTKHGAEAFEFKPIIICAKEHVLLYEQFALDAYKPEFNICMVAGNILGVRRSEQTRAKLRLARKKRVVSNETRKKLSVAQSARVYPRDVVEKIRAANTGQKRTPEARAKMSVAHIGQSRPHSAETRQKISAGQLAYVARKHG
jgi:group I intron endonuclease